MNPVLIFAINALNMSKNYLRDIVYGCPSKNSISILDLYHEQGISQSYFIIKYIQESNIYGKFIRFNIEIDMI